MNVNYFMFTALPCEAKPFISQYNLKKEQVSQPFAIYANQQTVLTVSGSGKVSMAAAVAYTLAKFEATENPVLINVGIAGHQSANLGELFCVHKITDINTEKSFYPQLMIKNACPSLTLSTVSKPETEYKSECLYDMEASGFYEIATRFTSSELIQVFKVVSDNQSSAIEGINAKKVSAWIATHTETMAKIIESLQLLAKNQTAPILRYYEPLLARYHFSVSSQHRLKALLQRWHVLTDDADIDVESLEFHNGKAVLHWLKEQIDKQTVKL